LGIDLYSVVLTILEIKLKFFYFNRNIIFMKAGGLSTNYKFFLLKIKEDLIILKKYFKITFLFIYMYKILIKFRTLKIIF
jgi:hypothetical protein